MMLKAVLRVMFESLGTEVDSSFVDFGVKND
jgi:hypothetical protein